jgi:hypothetical protein
LDGHDDSILPEETVGADVAIRYRWEVYEANHFLGPTKSLTYIDI